MAHSFRFLSIFYSFLPSCCIVVWAGFATAQPSAQTHTADRLFEKHAFQAANWKYLTAEQQETWVLERIAHGFRLNHDTQNAEKYYALVVGKSYDPAVCLYYAQALQSNGNTALAKEYFLKYDQLMAESGDLRGRLFAEGIDTKHANPLPNVEVKNLREVNSSQLDFSPALHPDGLIVSSTRPASAGAKMVDQWTGEAFSALYFSKKMEDGSFADPMPFSIGPGHGHHTGQVVLGGAGRLLFYTRSGAAEKNNGSKKRYLRIATALLDGSQWLHKETLDLGATACNDEHPAISRDGRTLVFASDRPGGFGGMDLYASRFSNGAWGAPVNLGPGVNTPGNEGFPFLQINGDLYFASDGWGGLGGLDVAFSQSSPDGFWGAAKPVGAPVNSPMDDFGLVLDASGMAGFFASAREGGLGRDDIYSFHATYPFDRILAGNQANAPAFDPVFAGEIPPNAEETSALFFAKLAVAAESGAPILLDHVQYDIASWHLDPLAAAQLESVAQFLRARPGLSIELASHTDTRGDAALNKEVSEMQAQYAAHFLIQQGVANNRVTALGRGSEHPIHPCPNVPDCPEATHRANRRMEIRFYETH